MRNPLLTELNSRINSAHEVANWINATIRVDADLPDMSTFSYPNRHIGINGFTLYGKDSSENERQLLSVSHDLVAYLYNLNSAFVFSVVATEEAVRPILSCNQVACQGVLRILSVLSNVGLFEVPNSILCGEDATTSSIITGFQIPDFDSLDDFISRHNGEHYVLHVIFRPIKQKTLYSEQRNADHMIEQLSTVQQRERQISQQKIVTQIEDVHIALGALNEFRELCVHGINTGFWAVHIIVSGSTKEQTSHLAFDLSGKLRGNTENNQEQKESILSRRHRIFAYAGKCFTETSWHLPVLAKHSQSWSILDDYSCDYVTNLGAARLVRIPHQTHKGYYVRDGGDAHNSKEPFSDYTEQPIGDSIVELGLAKGRHYTLTKDSISANALITGKSGGGKSTTMREILAQCKLHGIPFIVLEMVKKEYRSLKRYAGLEGIDVFSYGDDAKRLSINPLQPERGTLISRHIQSIKDAFCCLSDMESPLPELIEECMVKAYEEKGWALSDRAIGNLREYPTISDVFHQTDAVMRAAHYDRSQGDIQAALRLRLNYIRNTYLDYRVGEYGLNVDSVGQLFERSCIIELDDLSQEVRSFVAAIFVVRLREYLNRHKFKDHPGAILVIEEAHAIMPVESSVSTKSLANASNAFSQLIAEVRGLGLSTFVIDQSVSKLNTNAIINTGLKIVHGISYKADIEAISAAIGLNQIQQNQLAALPTGEVIVFDGSSARPEKYQIKIRMKSPKNRFGTMGCLFCPYAGNDRCKDIRNNCPEVKQSDADLLKDNSTEELIRVTQMLGLRVRKRLNRYESTCVAGKILDYVENLSDSSKSSMIFDMVEKIALQESIGGDS